MKKEAVIMRVHISFKKRVDKFIKVFKEKNNLEISTTDATRLINEKIDDVGGLKV